MLSFDLARHAKLLPKVVISKGAEDHSRVDRGKGRKRGGGREIKMYSKKSQKKVVRNWTTSSCVQGGHNDKLTIFVLLFL